MYDYHCGRCGGLVPEPMKAYGYAGSYCHCAEPKRPIDKVITTTIGTTPNPMKQNKSVEEVVEDEIEDLWLEYSDLHTKENLPRLRELFKDFQKTLQQERQTSQEREREIVSEILECVNFGKIPWVSVDAVKYIAQKYNITLTNPNKD